MSQIHETMELSTVPERQGIFPQGERPWDGLKNVDYLPRQNNTVQDRKTHTKPSLVIQLVKGKCSSDMLEL